jgi:copper(I)-binding protein
MKLEIKRLLCAALWLLAAASPAMADVAVDDPWIAETPPGATAAAAFMVIANDGAEARTVVGAQSPACERIEIHRSEMDGGIARMREQKSLAVPAGGSVTLEPGGIHLMLIRPKTLSAGDRVAITFELADGATLTVEAEVRKRGHHAH